MTGTGEYVLPDPSCTPGATNPQVSQADIASTICRSGWTSTVRPPESYTEPLKAQQMAAYGDTNPIGDYEEDHLIPLELGGAPTAVTNLWPEPGASPNPKDAVEDAANAAVCDGRVTLVAAQQAIAADWITFGELLGVTGLPSGATSAAPSSATTGSAPNASPVAGSSCSPTTSSGKCYRAGEYCPDADAGRTGTDANGNPITCQDENGRLYWAAP